jgi:hypothetical protein
MSEGQTDLQQPVRDRTPKINDTESVLNKSGVAHLGTEIERYMEEKIAAKNTGKPEEKKVS